jgi:hypothetical protein
MVAGSGVPRSFSTTPYAGNESWRVVVSTVNRAPDRRWTGSQDGLAAASRFCARIHLLNIKYREEKYQCSDQFNKRVL